MRKFIIIIAVLITTLINAQNTKHEIDLINRDLYYEIKNVSVDSKPVRDVLIENLEGIITRTNDTILKNLCKDYILTVKNIKLINGKPVQLSGLHKDALSNFKINEDKFKKTAFIHHKKTDKSPIRSYVAIKDGQAYLRIVTKYSGHGWVYMNKVNLIIDGQNYEYEVREVDRNVLSGSNVTERSDNLVNESTIKILNLLAGTSSDVEIRFQGSKRIHDFKLSVKDLIPIKQTIDLYNSF